MTEIINNQNQELNKVWYKYKNKEINTNFSEGYLADFHKTKDWLDWLKKEFEISEEDFKKKQFDILFKNNTTQPEYMRLFWTDEESRKTEWGKEVRDDFSSVICFPPIYLHPLMEDWLFSHCEDCGTRFKYDARQMKEHLKGKSREMSWCMVSCKGCGKVGKIDKDCIYRICKDHTDEQGRNWWVNAWNKLGVRV